MVQTTSPSLLGYAGTDTAPDLLSYLELHIEQGTVLEASGLPVGIVSGIQGVRWFEIEIHGIDAHAGTTPMQTRRDSFMAASELAMALRDLALSLSTDVRLTFGRVEVVPNSQNTIPSLTRFGVDLRHEHRGIIDAFESAAHGAVESLAAKPGFTATIRRTMDVAPVRFDAHLLATLSAAAGDLKIPTMTLPSGAMYDASSIALRALSVMIFVQSRQGISHNPAEWSEPDHIALGCELLARAVLAQAESLTNQALLDVKGITQPVTVTAE